MKFCSMQGTLMALMSARTGTQRPTWETGRWGRITTPRDVPYVLRAGLSARGEGHREVEGAVRRHQLLLL